VYEQQARSRLEEEAVLLREKYSRLDAVLQRTLRYAAWIAAIGFDLSCELTPFFVCAALHGSQALMKLRTIWLTAAVTSTLPTMKGLHCFIMPRRRVKMTW